MEPTARLRCFNFAQGYSPSLGPMCFQEPMHSFHHFSLNFINYEKMFLNKVCCMALMTAPVLNYLSLRCSSLTVYGSAASAGGTYRFTVLLAISVILGNFLGARWHNDVVCSFFIKIRLIKLDQ